MKLIARAAFAAICTTGGIAASAAPFIPHDDAQVVEVLPTRPGSAKTQARTLRAQLQRSPTELNLALRVARESIERARLEGDPREYGQAQAALGPWWLHSDPPAPVRLLRATLRQAQHDFSAALADLEALLRDERAPLALRAQAELTRAGVLQVLGRFADAAAACAQLAGPRYAALGAGVAWTARVCGAELQSLRGNADAADTQLAALARVAMASDAGWIALIRAELAQRRGDAGAEALYRQALEARADIYTLAAYADWLLDAGRAADVVTLLADRDAADALLLRKALAYRQLGDARAQSAIATLRARFDAARLRGDDSHRREEALFALHLSGDTAKALVLARDHWALQKEPADARLLVQAARAANQNSAAEPVWQFVRDTGYSDVLLRRAAVLREPERVARQSP
jgi:hypothetical protein